MRDAGNTPGRFLIFQSNGLDCAFALDAVHTVVPMAALFSPPGTPAGIAGFLNLRGRAIPVLRLDLLFALPEQKPGLHTPLVIVHAAGGLVGILTEQIRQIAAPAADSWLALGEHQVWHESAVASFTIDGRITHVLAADRLLLEQERSLVAAFEIMAQQRLRHWEASC